MIRKLVLAATSIASVALLACSGSGPDAHDAHDGAAAATSSGSSGDETPTNPSGGSTEPYSGRRPHTSVTLVNDSTMTLAHLYLAPAGSGSYGADDLGSDTLGKDELVEIMGVACGLMDVKLVDTRGRSCVVKGADFCAKSGAWSLDDAAASKCR